MRTLPRPYPPKRIVVSQLLDNLAAVVAKSLLPRTCETLPILPNPGLLTRTALTFTTVHARAALAIPRTGPLRDALIMGPELDKDFGASWFSRRRISKGPVRARGTSRPGVECLELTLHLLVLEFPKTAGLGVSLLRLRELRALCRGLCANSAAAPYRRTYRQEPNPQSTKCRSVAKNLL